MKPRWVIIGIAILLLLATASWWWVLPTYWSRSNADATQLTLYGNIDIRQVELSFRVQGRVASMPFEEGDHVSPGTLLATLDDEPYRHQLNVAEAHVDQFNANLDKLIAGPRPEEIAKAHAELEAQQAELDNAIESLERVQRLVAARTATAAQNDLAIATRDSAQARVQSARESLELLQAGTRAEDLAAARAQKRAAEAERATANTHLQDTQLKAPAAGTILSRVAEPGSIIAPGDPVYILSLTEPVWVRAYISEPHLGEIHPGLTVQVTSDTNPKRPYTGQIGFISPVAEFTPKSVETPELRTNLVYRLRIIIPQPDEELRQGMPMTIQVPLTSASNTPNSAQQSRARMR